MAKKTYKYKRGSITIGKKADGTPDRRFVTAKTVAEKNAKLAELRRLYTSGLHLGDMTVYEWSERWQKTFLANVSVGQKRSYRTRLVKEILPNIGSMQMRNVRKSHLIDLLQLYKGGKEGTVSMIRQTIKRMFADAVEEGIIERNPSLKLDLPETTVDKRRPLTDVERVAVLKIAETYKRRAYPLTLLYTGIRRGECLALLRADINFDTRRIRINKSLDLGEGNIGTISETKASKLRTDNDGERDVPIPDLLIPVLLELCETKVQNGLLFPKADGKLATQSSASWMWESFKNKCHHAVGVPTYRNKLLVEQSLFDDDVSPHYLRHDYGSMLYSAGVDKYARQAFLGHRNYDVTDRYTTLTDDAFYRNLDLINAYLYENWKSPICLDILLNHYRNNTCKNSAK